MSPALPVGGTTSAAARMKRSSDAANRLFEEEGSRRHWVCVTVYPST